MEASTRARVDAWLNGDYDADTQQEIRRLLDEGNTQALTDAFYKDLEFGTGGLRGLMGVGTNRINKYTIGMATQGLANYLKKSFADAEIKVAIAYDSRHRSDYFAQVTADVLSANGCTVYLFESLRPTPELSFAVRHLGCHSGVVLTASHNPKEYNGYKAYWDDGAQIVAPHDKNIIEEVGQIKNLNQVKFEADPARIHPIGDEVDEAYLQTLEELSVFPEAIRAQHDIPVVFSSIHGTGIVLIPDILKRFGFTNVHVVEAQAEPDGAFPTVVYPNPEESEALRLALEKAEAVGAELVMATDPDADRVGIAVRNADGALQLLNGNQTAGLLFYYLLRAWREADKLTGSEYIAKTIVTSDILDRMADHFGVECFNTLTGFKYIAGVIREQEGPKTFICGGEESYGYLIGAEVRDKDAVASCALIAEMAAYVRNQGQTLHDFLVEMYTRFGLYQERLLSVTKKGKAGAEEIQQMMHEMRENPPATINGAAVTRVVDYQAQTDRDLRTGETTAVALPPSNVLQYFTADGSKISARPSGTEPKIKFYFSVNVDLPDAAQFAERQQALEDRIDAIVADMKLG